MTRTLSTRARAAALMFLAGGLSCEDPHARLDVADPSRARVVLHTTAGDLTLALFPREAPRTVRQFLRLARAGVFDTTYFFTIAPGFVAQTSWAYDRSRPIDADQRALIKRLPLETSGLRHTRGMLSMGRVEKEDPDSAETSFCIMLGAAPQLDGKYTVFGQVEAGFEVLAEIEKLGTAVQNRPRSRVEISKALVIEEPAHRPAAVPAAVKPPEASPSCHPAGETETDRAASGAMAGPAAGHVNNPVAITDRVAPSGENLRTVLFQDLRIDRVYPSMHGPWTQRTFKLAPASRRVWLTGYRAEVLDGTTGRASQEFMCHTNLDLVGSATAPPAFKNSRSQLSISQGQTELRFPAGYGLALDNGAHREIRLTAMVLNSNYPDLDKLFDFRSTIRYLDDETARRRSLKPLFQSSVYTVCPTEPSRQPGDTTPACEPATAWEVHSGPYARKQTGHWIVPPGRQQITHDVTKQLSLPYDTTVHYIWVHLHPYGQSMELKDSTTGKTVWAGRAKNHPSKALLLATDHYSSTEGIPLYKDHTYELTTVYDNTSGKRVTAMAAFWMYLRERGQP